MSFESITPTLLDAQITDTSTWDSIDLSSLIQSGATGVAILVVNTDAFSRAIGFRKTGSTDDSFNVLALGAGRQRTYFVGVDGSRTLQYFNTAPEVTRTYLIGSFGSEATFPTNWISKGTINNTAYTDVSIATDTGGATATAAIVATGESYFFRYRKNGSTDDIGADDVPQAHFAIVGVDGSEIFECRDGSGGIALYLAGYFTAGITAHTNAIDRSTATTGSFASLATQSGALGYVYTARATAGTETITVRGTAHTSFDPYAVLESLGSGQFVAGGGTAEQKISAATADLFERAYFTTVGGGSTGTATPGVGLATVLGRQASLNNFTNVRYQEVLINGAGSPMSNRTGLRFSVWYSGQCSGAPDLSYSDMTTGPAGTASYSIATGSLVLGQKGFGVITDGGASLSSYTCGLLTFTYS